MTDCNLHFIITMQVYLCSKAIHQYNKMYLKKQEKKVGDLSYFSGFHIEITVFIYK